MLSPPSIMFWNVHHDHDHGCQVHHDPSLAASAASAAPAQAAVAVAAVTARASSIISSPIQSHDLPDSSTSSLQSPSPSPSPSHSPIPALFPAKYFLPSICQVVSVLLVLLVICPRLTIRCTARILRSRLLRRSIVVMYEVTDRTKERWRRHGIAWRRASEEATTAKTAMATATAMAMVMTTTTTMTTSPTAGESWKSQNENRGQSCDERETVLSACQGAGSARETAHRPCVTPKRPMVPRSAIAQDRYNGDVMGE